MAIDEKGEVIYSLDPIENHRINLNMDAIRAKYLGANECDVGQVPYAKAIFNDRTQRWHDPVTNAMVKSPPKARKRTFLTVLFMAGRLRGWV